VLFRDAAIGHAVANSLIVGVVATVIATVIGTMAGLALARHEFRGKRATRSLLYLPVIVPEIVVGAALVSLFGFIAMRLSLTTVILAHVAFSISYVALVVRARLAGFDRSLEEAAMDLGANPWQTFWRVTLPLIAPGVTAGALLVFTLSIDDYIITSFVAGPGATTLPLQIYSMVKTGVTPEINAVSTLLLAVTVALIAVAQRLLAAARPSA
jgi:spermidine/putrescine transport system permease protein